MQCIGNIVDWMDYVAMQHIVNEQTTIKHAFIFATRWLGWIKLYCKCLSVWLLPHRPEFVLFLV